MIFKGENSKYGLKDENGNVLVDPIFDDIQDFSPDGYAKVKLGKKMRSLTKMGILYFLIKSLRLIRHLLMRALNILKPATSKVLYQNSKKQILMMHCC